VKCVYPTSVSTDMFRPRRGHHQSLLQEYKVFKQTVNKECLELFTQSMHVDLFTLRSDKIQIL